MPVADIARKSLPEFKPASRTVVLRSAPNMQPRWAGILSPCSRAIYIPRIDFDRAVV
jgi:hypothetical protein